MKTEKPLTPPSPPLSGGESTAETPTTPSPDKRKVAPATFAIGRAGEGLHPKHIPYNPRLTALARQGIRVLRYTNIDVSQQLAGIYDDLNTHLEKNTS